MAERFRIYCPPCLFRSLPCVQPTDPGLMPADWMEQQLAYLDPTLKRSLGLKTGDDLRRRIKAMAVQVRGVESEGAPEANRPSRPSRFPIVSHPFPYPGGWDLVAYALSMVLCIPAPSV